MESTSVRGVVDLSRVHAAIEPVLVAHGVVLDDLQWTNDRAGWVLRVVIERVGATEVGGGVTLADCADVSRDVSTVLDVEDLIAQRYNLEVSSPGLDRPLRRADDFARFVGKLARVKLERPAPDGQRLLRGTLDTAPQGRVAVVVDGKRIEVDHGDVAEANLVFELEPQAKKGARSSRKQRTGQRGATGRREPSGPRGSPKA